MVMQLPRAEKVRLMEVLWADLSRTEADFDSPSWHDTVLRETAQRVAKGGEQVLDWEEAKRRLRD